MQPHHESAIKRHLDTLDDQTYRNVQAHANAVDNENHPSAAVLAKWAAGITGAIFGPGMIWKLVKVIKNHRL